MTYRCQEAIWVFMGNQTLRFQYRTQTRLYHYFIIPPSAEQFDWQLVENGIHFILFIYQNIYIPPSLGV